MPSQREPATTARSSADRPTDLGGGMTIAGVQDTEGNGLELRGP